MLPYSLHAPARYHMRYSERAFDRATGHEPEALVMRASLAGIVVTMVGQDEQMYQLQLPSLARDSLL